MAKNPLRSSHSEVKKSVDQYINYSPDFKLKKINNYDNIIKSAPRNIVEKYDIHKFHSKNPSDS